MLVTFTDQTGLRDYLSRNHLPFRVLLDPDRSGYRAFGLGRGSVGRVYGRRMAKRYLEIFRESGVSQLRRPTEDTLQLGGDFVIGPDGILRFGFWGDGPDDRPSVDQLVEQVEALRQ